MLPYDRQPPSALTSLAQVTWARLTREWLALERMLSQTPLLQRITSAFTLEDYQRLLLCLRPPAPRSIQSLSPGAGTDSDAQLRTRLLEQLEEARCDAALLETDFLAGGGTPETFRAAPHTAGTQALHAYLIVQAAQTRPVGLIGALWVLDAISARLGDVWAAQIEQGSGLMRCCTRFLRHRAATADPARLHRLLERRCTEQAIADDIVGSARFAGRLYVLALEEAGADLNATGTAFLS